MPNILILILVILITSCSGKNHLIYETNRNDLNSNCQELKSEITDLKTNSLRRAKRSQKIRNIKNIGLIMAALPTAFTSLILLDFSDNISATKQEIQNRINAIEKLLLLKQCSEGGS